LLQKGATTATVAEEKVFISQWLAEDCSDPLVSTSAKRLRVRIALFGSIELTDHCRTMR
jgi:hypothetical protein